MTDKIARVCDYCGKTDVLEYSSDSNGMILVQSQDVIFVLMRNVKEKEGCRPSINLTGKTYCPQCLPKAIVEWIKKIS